MTLTWRSPAKTTWIRVSTPTTTATAAGTSSRPAFGSTVAAASSPPPSSSGMIGVVLRAGSPWKNEQM